MNRESVVTPTCDGPGLDYLTAEAKTSQETTIWWLGQAGFAIEHAGHRVLIDPYLSDTLAAKYAGKTFPHTRLQPIPVDAKQLRGIDAVLHSHAHTDHLDPATITGILTNNSPTFLAPRARLEIALTRNIPSESLNPVTAGDCVQIAPGISVTVVPAAHEQLEFNDQGDSVFLGYILDVAGLRIYHSGDCVPFEGQGKLLRDHCIDLALLPINGRDSYRLKNGVPGNFTVAEAISLCIEANIPAVVGHHFGLFDFNTVDPKVAANEFEARAGKLQWTIPRLGQPYSVVPACATLKSR